MTIGAPSTIEKERLSWSQQCKSAASFWSLRSSWVACLSDDESLKIGQPRVEEKIRRIDGLLARVQVGPKDNIYTLPLSTLLFHCISTQHGITKSSFAALYHNVSFYASLTSTF
jgi:hypothetical protein